MNVRHPMGDLHSFSVKNIFYNKNEHKAFLFSRGDLIDNPKIKYCLSVKYYQGGL